MSQQNVYEALYITMGTYIDGGEYLTPRVNIASGIIDYANDMLCYNLMGNYKYNPTFADMKYEINNSRPAIISLNQSANHIYGNHSVTLIGYSNYYSDYCIIKDGFSSTPESVYIAYNSTYMPMIHRIYQAY